MSILSIKNLKIPAKHGVYDFEKNKSGIFEIDIHVHLDLANAIAPDCIQEYIGIRPGEKIHEEMISINDSENTVEIGKYYAILPKENELIRKKYLS